MSVASCARATPAARWEPTLDIDSDVHQVLTTERVPRLVLAASAVGLGISRNGGDSWHFATAGLHALYQRAVAVVPDAVLVSTARSERGQQSAVYRRSMSGRGPFRKCERGLADLVPEQHQYRLSGRERRDLPRSARPTACSACRTTQERAGASCARGLRKIGCLVFAGASAKSLKPPLQTQGRRAVTRGVPGRRYASAARTLSSRVAWAIDSQCAAACRASSTRKPRRLSQGTTSFSGSCFAA